MPRQGDVDTSYTIKLKNIGIELLEPFCGSKAHHEMQCVVCLHVWTATPLSKLQNYRKWGSGGCPKCTRNAHDKHKITKRTQNLQMLQDRGLEVLSNYNGQYVEGTPGESIPVDVTVKNTNCGHIFTSSSKNLLTRGVTCPDCARKYKNSVLTANSKARSEEWQKTASDWKLYKSSVTKMTRLAYKQHNHTINPLNLPTGKAGTPGAYHLDHIVPIRYCFDHSIPSNLCAHYTNLQMLGWRENVGSRDKIKDSASIPIIFEGYIP